jgi:hypothetical protein
MTREVSTTAAGSSNLHTTTITLGPRDDYGTGSIDTSYVAMPLLAAEV